MKKLVINLSVFLAFFILVFPLFSQNVNIGGNNEINQCETNTYSISITNTSGSDLTELDITAQLVNLIPGFSYVSGTASIDINGGAAFCTANPSESGTDLIWDIDALCGGFTLSNGDTLNISFDLATDCDAVSGSLNVLFDYVINATPQSDNTGLLNIKVNPGAITIKKTPNVVSKYLGDNVTWTLTIENTGFGVIENVEVTDVMGAGFAYVSSTESGVNAGQTITWTSTEYATLASMNPGDILTMDITATVIACDNLDNTADVRFGCDPSPSTACYDTVDHSGSSARASVQRIVRTPVLSFNPPDISFTYCENTLSGTSFTITNDGDGIAYDVYTIIDFGNFTVSNISANAIYNNVDKRFELTNPIAASGGTYNLSFDLTYDGDWCDGSFPDGDLLWQKLYKDECDQEFYPPVELSSMDAPTNVSSLSVAKSGAGAEIQIGDPVTYTVTSSYSGPINCGSGTTGLVTVIDTVPAGFTVTDAGGGTWDNTAGPTGNGSTGGTITWTYTPPASLNTSVTFQSPDTSQCETYCNTIFTNTIDASVTDCCGCTLTASASETTAIECEEGVTSEKSSSSPTERCADTTYTNTYTFSGGSAVVLSDLSFEEHAENQQVYNGNLTIMLGVSNVTGCVVVNDNTPGGSLLLDFSGCAATSLAGQTLTISYNLTATASTVAACTNSTFYSWSSLDMDNPGGSECLGDGIIHETTQVSIASPSMSLSISGLGQIVNSCDTKTITMTLTQTSSTSNPKDVKLVLSGLNYYIINPGAVTGTGVTPTSTNFIPSLNGNNYEWIFDDAFTGNNQASTITIEVQKRCTGTGDLLGTAYWDDLCTDDTTIDELCSTDDTETPALLLIADLLIEKTPETYYAATNTVQWEIYITNRGTGTAYNVWMDDVLGSGLIYEHGVNPVVVDNMTGVTINDSLDHDGGAINGASVEITSMLAGERRQITFIAKQIDCSNLTNDVTTNWGCNSQDCKPDATDSSIVTLPAPNLINTNTITPANGVDACESPAGFITLRNAGQITCYNLEVTETLPPGLIYVGGSTRWRLNGGGWNGPNVSFDPSPIVSPLVWTKNEISALASAASGDTIEIEFDMVSDCPFNGGDITVATQYENPCATVFNTSNSTFTITFIEPDVAITKVLDPDQPIDCNQTIFWNITITNNGSETLPILWVEDTLDAAFTYIATTVISGGAYIADTGDNPGAGQVVRYEITDLPTGQSVVLRMEATTDSSPCSTNTDNTVEAWWGCGNPDGSSATKPGVDGPDAGLCLGAASVSDVSSETRQPTMSYLSVGMTPSSISSCDTSSEITVTIENGGPTAAYDVDLVLTLPAGLTYNDGTSQSSLSTDSAAAIAALAGIGNPTITGGGTILTWGDTGDKANDLEDVIDADGGNDTLVLRFTVQSNCYLTSNMVFALRYYDCCGITQYNTPSTNQLTALNPDLAITKTADITSGVCGSDAVYTVTVTNNGTGNAEIVRVVDTLGDWLDWNGNFTEDVAGTVTPALIGSNPQTWGWEFNDLAPGDTATFTFQATLNPDAPQDDCTNTLRQNNVEVIWACGTGAQAIDDNPNTITYDCTDSGSDTAGPITQLMPNLVVSSITPVVSCTSEGTFSGSITVRVTNNGDGPTDTTLFTVQVTDGKGWTGTGTYSTAIAAGGYADITINTGTWAPVCNCAVPYSFNATVDLNNDICECNETDNTFGPFSYSPPIPDVTITDIDFTNISCSSDGISGNVRVQVENLGCANASNFQLALTTDGCLTFTPQTISINAGTSTWFTFNISGSWADCTTEDCDFTATVDGPGALCECDGDNNSRTETYSTTLPDLVVTNIDYSNVSCTNDDFSGFVSVTVQNNGFGSATNFQVSLATDGCLTFSNETFAGILTNGQSTTINFAVSSSWADPSDCACDFTATVDATNTVCECNGSNNTLTTTYNNPLPKFNVNSVTPLATCTSDGNISGTVSVNVSNTGCALANGVVVRLTSDCGHTFIDQTLNLSQGANQTLTFNYTPVATACTCTFTAVIDPDDAICESSNSNHSLASAAYTPDIPDLLVQSDTLAISCSTDGEVSISGNITVQNSGCGNLTTSNLPVRFTLYDNTGCSGNIIGTWTESFSPISIASGGAQTFTISAHTITENMVTNSNSCNTSIGVELDYSNSICEYDGTNNTYCADNKVIDIPDLRLQSDTIGVTCTSDGNIQVAGNIVLANDGCGSNMTTNVPVRYTLWSGNNCTGTNLGQWTETLTSANIAAGGGTQGFTITPQSITTNLVTNSTGCEVSLQIEVDHTNTICESDGTDNDYCASSIPVDIPNLEYQSDTLVLNCSSEGSSEISGTVTVANNGCGSNMTGNIPVRFTVFDNINCTGNQISQWTDTFSSSNIPAGGGTQAFTINTESFTNNFVNDSTACQVSIRIELDYNGTDICESDGTDNDTCVNKTVEIPDLIIDSVASSITCLSDGSLTGTTVTVSNIGCSDALNVVVRLSSDCGLTFVDETVNIAAGATEDVFFAFASGITDCNCTFLAIVDPDNLICESDGTNNTGSSTISMLIPDLAVQADTLSIRCSSNNDGEVQISGNVTLVNDGCGPNMTSNVPMRFTLYDNTGCSGNVLGTWTDTFTSANISSGGGTQSFSIRSQTVISDLMGNSNSCRYSIFVEADYSDTICEWDGTNNTYCADNKDVNIPDLSVQGDTIAVTCFKDGEVQISGNVSLINDGCGSNMTSDVPMRFTLYDNTGCTGNVLSTWTENFSSANINSRGGTQSFSINPQTLATDIITNSNNCKVSIKIEVDYSGTICELNSSNNEYCADNVVIDIPDIQVHTDSLTTDCSSSGDVTVSGSVVLKNSGCGSSLTSNIPVRFTIYDNIDCSGNQVAQWTETFTSLNIASKGGTQSYIINPKTFDFDMTSKSTDCLFSIRIEADYTGEICESIGTNNDLCTNKTAGIPDLSIKSIATSITCLSDGNITGTTVSASNAGCGDAVGVVVRLSSDCGLTFTEQIIDLKAGETKEMFFPFDQKITGCNCNFTGIIDPDNLICESDLDNNTTVSAASMSIPDLEVSSDNTITGENIRIECADDGKIGISGSVGILNSGCGSAFNGPIPTRFTLYSGRNGSGRKILEWTDSISGGSIKPGTTVYYKLTEQIIDLDIVKNSDNGWLSVKIELDFNNSICEWDGTNNDYLIDKKTEFIDLIIDKIEYVCNPDNSVSISVTVSNTGTENVSGVYLEIINGDDTTNQLIDLPAGSTKTFDFKTKVYTGAINSIFTFNIDRANDVCELSNNNNSQDIKIYCVPPGTPKLELTKTCPNADIPGGIVGFEIRVKNTGDGDMTDVVIEDILPEKFKYAAGTSLINGTKGNDPTGTKVLKWEIGNLKKGDEILITYNAITDSDIKEGRYCNQAYAFGRTLDDKEITSGQVSCCTIITRNKEGCCLRIETEGKGFYKIPEMPVAFFKPYFHTEDAMYLSYAALKFYKNTGTSKDGIDERVEFIRERLKNYAMSSIDEFYLNSNMGIIMGNGLAYSYGGAYPITKDNGWKREGADKTMTLSQVAFEMLALNEAVLLEKNKSYEKLKDILERKVGFIQKLEMQRKTDDVQYPHSWQVGKEKLEKGDKDASLFDKTVLYFSVNTLIENGYNGLTETSEWLEKDIKKLIKKDKNKYRGKEELFYILGLSKAGKTKLTKKRMKRFNKLVVDKKMDVDTLYVSALAMYSNLELGGDRADNFYSEINKKYYNSNIGIYSETLPDQTYKIDQRQLGSLILSMGRLNGEKQKKLSSDIYRMIDETGLFLNKRHSAASFVPVNLIKNSSFMDQNVPIISTLKLNKNTAPVFSRDVRIYPGITDRIEESVVFPNYSKMFSPSYEDDPAKILAHSYSLQHIGSGIKSNQKRVISERGRTLENVGKKYLEFILDSKGGLFYEKNLIIPFSKISVKGKLTDKLSIEPLILSNDYSTESFANLFIAENIYIANKGRKTKEINEAIIIQKRIIEAFANIGYVPEKFKLYIDKEGSIKIAASKEKADKITIVKLLSGFDTPVMGKFIESGKVKKLKSDDLIFLSHFPKYKAVFEKELEEVSTTFARDITQKSASTIANRILGKDEGEYLSDIKKFWEEDVQLPVGRVEKMRQNGGSRIIYDIQKYLLFLSALKKDDGFIFNRSLDYFSYLLEGEWGIIKNDKMLIAPPKEIVLIKERPRNYPEPGDIFTKQVRIFNTCLESYQGLRYFENLFIWTDFINPLSYYGTEIKDDLAHQGGFKWKFKGMSEGGYLSFMYQALIPSNFTGNNVKWHTFVSSIDKSDDIHYGDRLDRCEDDHQGAGIFIRPLTEIKGIVYEDSNVNGRRDIGETGVTGILIKDSLGRSLITDENGEFRIKTGTERLVVQIVMQALAADLTMTTKPTEVINNAFDHNISFGVITCINVRGFVYNDLNGNGKYDKDEPKFGGISAKTRRKEFITDKDGNFEINNLPKSWKDELKIQKRQPFIDIKGKDLKIFIVE